MSVWAILPFLQEAVTVTRPVLSSLLRFLLMCEIAFILDNHIFFLLPLVKFPTNLLRDCLAVCKACLSMTNAVRCSFVARFPVEQAPNRPTVSEQTQLAPPIMERESVKDPGTSPNYSPTTSVLWVCL